MSKAKHFKKIFIGLLMCSVTVLLGSFLFPINGSAKTRVGSYYHNLNTELKYSNLSAKVSSLSSSNAQQDVSNLNKSEKINNPRFKIEVQHLLY